MKQKQQKALRTKMAELQNSRRNEEKEEEEKQTEEKATKEKPQKVELSPTSRLNAAIEYMHRRHAAAAAAEKRAAFSLNVKPQMKLKQQQKALRTKMAELQNSRRNEEKEEEEKQTEEKATEEKTQKVELDTDTVEKKRAPWSKRSSNATNAPSSNLTLNVKEGWTEPKLGWCRDVRTLERREYELQIMKCRPAYKSYLSTLPKYARKKGVDPRTPNKWLNHSRRSWDKQVKIWKKAIFQWATETPLAAEEPLAVEKPLVDEASLEAEEPLEETETPLAVEKPLVDEGPSAGTPSEAEEPLEETETPLAEEKPLVDEAPSAGTPLEETEKPLATETPTSNGNDSRCKKETRKQKRQMKKKNAMKEMEEKPMGWKRRK